jgi:hypothetical protein
LGGAAVGVAPIAEPRAGLSSPGAPRRPSYWAMPWGGAPSSARGGGGGCSGPCAAGPWGSTAASRWSSTAGTTGGSTWNSASGRPSNPLGSLAEDHDEDVPWRSDREAMRLSTCVLPAADDTPTRTLSGNGPVTSCDCASGPPSPATTDAQSRSKNSSPSIAMPASPRRTSGASGRGSSSGDGAGEPATCPRPR